MEQTLLAPLLRENPHWSGQAISVQPGTVEREVSRTLEKELEHRLMASLVGLRRAGKTTLMKLTIDRLLRRGVPPRHILYFPFDEVTGAVPRAIEQILTYYETEVLGAPLESRGDRVHLFLDEVHYVPAWASVLKRYYDRSPRAKFFIAASVSVRLARKSRESLAGRVLQIEVPPFSFAEFVQSRGIRAGPWSPLGEVKEATFSSAASVGEQLDALIDGYLLRGGLPELAAVTDASFAKRYVRESLVDRIVYADLPASFGIRSPEAALRLLAYVAEAPGSLVDFSALAAPLGVDQRTVADYLTYLEQAFLVHRVGNRTRSAARGFRSLKRFYPADTGICAAFGSWSLDSPPPPDVIGHLAETSVFLHLRRAARLTFLRDSRGHEVDFVAETPGGPVPVEVKYARDAEGVPQVEWAMERLGSPRGLLVTRTRFELREGPGKSPIIVAPLWWFLLSDWSGGGAAGPRTPVKA